MTYFVGLGEMVLGERDLSADVLEGRLLQRKKICHMFSHSTAGPPLGLISGCYPLDASTSHIRREPGSES